MRVVLEQVTKRYGAREALCGVDLRLDGGMVGLLGPNGAGKTTLLRIVATLLRPTSGHVYVDGTDLVDGRQRRAVRARLGYLPQDVGVYPDLTGREFLDYMSLLKQVHNRGVRRQQIEALISTVHLAENADRKVGTYSGGMKRRLGIAQALLGNPRLLIVDEPTAGLDPEERIRLRSLLTRLAGDRVVLLSTHVVEDIAHTCERVVVLESGRIAFDGPTSDLAHVAAGRCWQFVAASDDAVPVESSVISALPHTGGTVYRVVGPEPHGAVREVEPRPPTLEDGYVWLVRRARAAVAFGVSA